MVLVDEFAKDTEVIADIVQIEKSVATGKKGAKAGKTTTSTTDTAALWGMLCADDASIVSCSPGSLEKTLSIIVPVARVFGLMVSEPKTDIMCMPPKGMAESTFAVSAAGQTYQQTSSFVYLGRTITADGKVDREIASRICRAWKRFCRNGAPRCTTVGQSATDQTTDSS